MQKLIVIILALALTACSLNQGFPKEIDGKLKPINRGETTYDNALTERQQGESPC